MIMVARVPRQRGGGKQRPDCHDVANVVAVSVAIPVLGAPITYVVSITLLTGRMTEREASLNVQADPASARTVPNCGANSTP